jgi:hypothetical protein
VTLPGLLVTVLLFFAVQVTLQWYAGAYSSEFGSYPDEAGHYVTGLMVRDYIASGQYSQPMAFAEDYYIHYPKVSLGHWPPLFYAVQAAWTLLFSPSTASILLLMAFMTTLLAVTLFLALRKDFGDAMGIGVGLLFIILPIIQRFSSMVMAEIQVALLTIWAVLFYGRYLETEKWRDAIWFGIFSSLTIMTKGNGVALALVPPLAVVLNRRLYLFARLSFWLPAIIVLILCGPFYWSTFDMVRNGWITDSPNLGFTLDAVRFYPYQFVKILGVGLVVLVGFGFYDRLIRPFRRERIPGQWAAVGALFIGVLIYHLVVPCGMEGRHMIPALPAGLMFLTAGISATADLLRFRLLRPEKRTLAVAFVMALFFMVETYHMPKKAWGGFKEPVHQLLMTPDLRDSVFLISSDSSVEGMFIAEVAMQEQRPGHIVLRASKVLASSLWDGRAYSPFYETEEEMMDYLRSVPVGIAVIDLTIPEDKRTSHHEILLQTMEAYAGEWELIGTYPLVRNQKEYLRGFQIYRLAGHETKPVETIRIDMQKMLNKTLKKTLINSND